MHMRSTLQPRTAHEQMMQRYWEVINAEKEAERIVNQRYDNAEISTENAIAPPSQYKTKKEYNRGMAQQRKQERLKRIRASNKGWHLTGAEREALRQHIFDRDKHKCTECDNEEDLQVHHIIARADGGSNEPDNLQTLCGMCHAEKHKGQAVYHVMLSRAKKFFIQKE